MKYLLVPFALFVFFISYRTYKGLNVKEKYKCDDCHLSLTNLRKENVGLYGGNADVTKNIDKFFSESIKFNNAVAPASLTFTDAYSLFYSLQPNVHHFFNRSDREKAKEIVSKYKSYPEILKNNGYNTAAFVSDEDYTAENGFGKMFDLYFDKQFYLDNKIKFIPWEYNIGSKDLIDPAIGWLDKNKDKKLFLYLQLYDMHCPYTPPKKILKNSKIKKSNNINFNDCYMTLGEVEKTKQKGKTYYKLLNWKSFLGRESVESTLFSDEDISYLKYLYDEELRFADHNLEKLFNYLESSGLTKNSIIVFYSEHGDYLGEAGYYMKSAVTARGNLHNSNLSFPLMIRIPTLKDRVEQNQLFQSIDFAPTVLDMLDVNQMEKKQGKSFISVLGKNKQLNEFIYSFSIRKRDFLDFGKFLVESIQNSEWKYDFFQHYDFDGKEIEKKQFVFDLKNDPLETTNLSTNTKILERLEEQRKKLRKKYEENPIN
jgi:arylsulfatase A-like enzyme